MIFKPVFTETQNDKDFYSQSFINKKGFSLSFIKMYTFFSGEFWSKMLVKLVIWTEIWYLIE